MYTFESIFSFITPDSRVISHRRQYNAYREFLEHEAKKFKIGKEAELQEKEQRVPTMHAHALFLYSQAYHVVM